MAEKKLDIASTTEKSGISISTVAAEDTVLTNSVMVVFDDTVEAGELMTAIQRAAESVQEYMQDK